MRLNPDDFDMFKILHTAGVRYKAWNPATSLPNENLVF